MQGCRVHTILETIISEAILLLLADAGLARLSFGQTQGGRVAMFVDLHRKRAVAVAFNLAPS